MTLDSLYSCFIIEATDPTPLAWRVFTYGRSQHINGSLKIADAVHTNVPRAGDVGLPMGWEARISRWRATMNCRQYDEPVMDWAAETDVALRYNDKVEARTSLLELLMAPQPLGDRHAPMGGFDGSMVPAGTYLWLRENFGYEACVQTQRAGLVEALQRYLITYTQQARMICWIRLDGSIDKGSW